MCFRTSAPATAKIIFGMGEKLDERNCFQVECLVCHVLGKSAMKAHGSASVSFCLVLCCTYIEFCFFILSLSPMWTLSETIFCIFHFYKMHKCGSIQSSCISPAFKPFIAMSYDTMDIIEFSESDSEVKDIVLAVLTETIHNQGKTQKNREKDLAGSEIDLMQGGISMVHMHDLFLSFFIASRSESAFVHSHPLFSPPQWLPFHLTSILGSCTCHGMLHHARWLTLFIF